MAHSASSYYNILLTQIFNCCKGLLIYREGLTKYKTFSIGKQTMLVSVLYAVVFTPVAFSKMKGLYMNALSNCAALHKTYPVPLNQGTCNEYQHLN